MIIIRKFKVAFYWLIVFNERVAFESEELYHDANSAEAEARNFLRNLSLEIKAKKEE